MQTPKQGGSDQQLQTQMSSGPQPQPQQHQLQQQMSGTLSFNGNSSKEDDEMSKSVLSKLTAKQEEIEMRKTEVKERVQHHLGRIEEETRRLAKIREELESLADPVTKEALLVRKKIDSTDKGLKLLGLTCQKKEKEYKDALEAFNDKTKEKAQLVSKMMELLSESERLRMKKLEELGNSLESNVSSGLVT